MRISIEERIRTARQLLTLINTSANAAADDMDDDGGRTEFSAKEIVEAIAAMASQIEELLAPLQQAPGSVLNWAPGAPRPGSAR